LCASNKIFAASLVRACFQPWLQAPPTRRIGAKPAQEMLFPSLGGEPPARARAGISATEAIALLVPICKDRPLKALGFYSPKTPQ
jgi:hypothetical protein